MHIHCGPPPSIMAAADFVIGEEIVEVGELDLTL